MRSSHLYLPTEGRFSGSHHSLRSEWMWSTGDSSSLMKDSGFYLRTRAETTSGDRTRRRDDRMMEAEDASSRFSASSWGACVMKESDSVTHISPQPLPLPEVLLSSSDTRYGQNMSKTSWNLMKTANFYKQKKCEFDSLDSFSFAAIESKKWFSSQCSLKESLTRKHESFDHNCNDSSTKEKFSSLFFFLTLDTYKTFVWL